MDTKQIEIFRAGTHTDARGQTLTFTANDIQHIADAYNPSLHDAPLVVGHPAIDAPAYGWVKGLNVDGDVLCADIEHIDPDFADIVRKGYYRTCSAAFYAPDSPNNPRPGGYYLRHIGLLGAHPPAVKGLKRVEFGDEESGIIQVETQMTMKNENILSKLQRALDRLLTYGESEENQPVNEPEPTQNLQPTIMDDTSMNDEKLAALAAENQQLKERINALEAEKRERENAAILDEATKFTESLVAKGKLAPAAKDTVTTFLTVIQQPVKGVEFADADGKPLINAIKDWLNGMPEQVQFGEIATKDTAAVNAPSIKDAEFADANVDSKGLNDLEKINALAREKGISFEAAAHEYMRVI